MSVVQKIDRRRAQRYQAAFEIRFSVNGGPEVVSKTLNFTSHSLAIQSDVSVDKGDAVDVQFGGLPAIKGEVARVFPEGFAVVLSKASLDMLTQNQQDGDTGAIVAMQNGVTSPFIEVSSIHPARALITSGVECEPGYNCHLLSIIAENPSRFDNICNVWISSDGTRWVASGLQFEKHDNRSLAVMTLNDWQAHMAAAYGLKISVINEHMSEWTVEIAPEAFCDHLEALQPQKIAATA